MTHESTRHRVRPSSADVFVEAARRALELGATVTSLAEDARRPWREVLQVGDDLRGALARGRRARRAGSPSHPQLHRAALGGLGVPRRRAPVRDPAPRPPPLGGLRVNRRDHAPDPQLRPKAILTTDPAEVRPVAPDATATAKAGNLTLLFPPTTADAALAAA